MSQNLVNVSIDGQDYFLDKDGAESGGFLRKNSFTLTLNNEEMQLLRFILSRIGGSSKQLSTVIHIRDKISKHNIGLKGFDVDPQNDALYFV
jgi:hypothetical protein